MYVICTQICSRQMHLIFSLLPLQLLKRRKCSSHLSHYDSQLLARMSVWARVSEAHHINTCKYFLCQREMYSTI